MKFHDFTAVLLCTDQLLRECGHIILPSPVGNLHALCPQPYCGTGCVHGHVAAADDDDALSVVIRLIAVSDPPEDFHCRVDAFRIFPFDTHLPAHMSADTDIDRIVVRLQVPHIHVAAHAGVGMHLDAGRQNRIDFLIQHFPRQTVVRNAVPEHTAQLLPLFVNRDGMAHSRQIIGGTQASRAAADNDDLLPGRLCADRLRNLSLVIHGIPLQRPDIDRVIHQCAPAAGFTRMLADVSADRRQRVVLPDEVGGILVTSFSDQRNISRHIHVGRAQGNARNRLLLHDGTSSMLNMFNIIIPESLQSGQHHAGRFKSDGTI